MWYNGIIATVLRSPLHMLLSNSMLLLTYTGRKSGKSYTIPVSYIREGDYLWVLSRADRTWWRNLRSVAPVMLRLGGRDLPATATAIADDVSAVSNSLAAYLRRAPQFARYLQVPLSSTRQPDAAALASAATRWVMIEIVVQAATPSLTR